MLFVRTFKGYEDRTREVDEHVNNWVAQHQVKVVDIKPLLSHEQGSRAGSGDLLICLVYEADRPIVES